MKKDKLTLRTEIQKDFDNETIKNINIAINLSKFMRFLYSESTIFFASFIPFFIMLMYVFSQFSSVDSGVIVSTSLILIVTHFLLYKFFYTKVLFKDSKDVYDEFDYTIDVLNEIKSEKV
jgi:hypothetical protein